MQSLFTLLRQSFGHSLDCLQSIIAHRYLLFVHMHGVSIISVMSFSMAALCSNALYCSLGSFLQKVYALMRHVCPGATVDQLLTWLRKRTKQEFASFLDKEENADVVDDVLEADDRKDAKETKKTGQASHVFKAQVAEVVRGLKLPAESSDVAPLVNSVEDFSPV